MKRSNLKIFETYNLNQAKNKFFKSANTQTHDISCLTSLGSVKHREDHTYPQGGNGAHRSSDHPFLPFILRIGSSPRPRR